jgi:hypothetical protein
LLSSRSLVSWSNRREFSNRLAMSLSGIGSRPRPWELAQSVPGRRAMRVQLWCRGNGASCASALGAQKSSSKWRVVNGKSRPMDVERRLFKKLGWKGITSGRGKMGAFSCPSSQRQIVRNPGRASTKLGRNGHTPAAAKTACTICRASS